MVSRHAPLFTSIFLLLVIMAFDTVAQVYPYRHYDTRAGLPNPNVYGIAADSLGLLWVATENGLARFDGLNFKNYSLEQLGVSSYISAIAPLSKYEMAFGVGVL